MKYISKCCLLKIVLSKLKVIKVYGFAVLKMLTIAQTLMLLVLWVTNRLKYKAIDK